MKSIVATVPLEEWLALDWLLSQIGSWTNSRWDQHLRHRFGDVRTDQIIEALGYRKMPAGEAPVAREPGVQPCDYTRERRAEAAKQLSLQLDGQDIPHLAVVATKDDELLVYVNKRSKKHMEIPDHWDSYPVTINVRSLPQ